MKRGQMALVPTTEHSRDHAISGCGCSMASIGRCVICGKGLEAERIHVDTCGKRCFLKLLRLQRERS